MDSLFLATGNTHPLQQQGKTGAIGMGHVGKINQDILTGSLDHAIGLLRDARHSKFTELTFYGKLAIAGRFNFCLTQVTGRLFFV